MLSEYEQIRLENIKRNETFLIETLGIKQKHQYHSDNSNKTALKKRKPSESEKKILLNIDDVSIHLRRSSRVASLPVVSYMEFPTLHNISVIKSSKDSVSNLQDDLAIGHIIGYDDKTKIKSESELGIIGNHTTSCSSIHANYNYFMTDENICKPITEYGKAAIMELSSHSNVKFNKYPGVIEWNNCMYLWVNIGVGGESEYPNVLSMDEDGRWYMMWFGGSRMHKDSKTTQRLIHLSNPSFSNLKVFNHIDTKTKNDIATTTNTTTTTTTTTIATTTATAATTTATTTTTANNDAAVLLFVRLPGQPYACLGRLHWVSLDLLSSPIKIKWELIDHNRYCHNQYFQQLVSIAGKQ